MIRESFHFCAEPRSLAERKIPAPPKSHPLPTSLFPTPRSVEELAYCIDREKQLRSEEVDRDGYFLAAIDKRYHMTRRNFELKEAAISEARDFWVNKGFLAVEVFHFDERNKIAVDYHGLRN